jgi:dihydrofolate synthase/folylpolyglutamate synthase
MVNDKDPSKVFPILPINAVYYFCKPDIPRGLDAEECKKIAQNYHLEGLSYESVQFAYASALKNAKKDDLILIGGSTFVVAEVV